MTQSRHWRGISFLPPYNSWPHMTCKPVGNQRIRPTDGKDFRGLNCLDNNPNKWLPNPFISYSKKKRISPILISQGKKSVWFRESSIPKIFLKPCLDPEEPIPLSPPVLQYDEEIYEQSSDATLTSDGYNWVWAPPEQGEALGQGAWLGSSS